jgi:hypothetical protein
MGPAGTVTGLHYDWNPNIFTNVRGVKDWILFPAGQDHALQPSLKFDWGATCSSVDVSRVAAMPAAVRERFVAARGGWYARVEAGDALIVPPGTWHAVVARTPCISVSAFGLTVLQVLTNGVARTFQNNRLFPNLTVLENVLIGEHARLTTGPIGAVAGTPKARAEEEGAPAGDPGEGEPQGRPAGPRQGKPGGT